MHRYTTEEMASIDAYLREFRFLIKHKGDTMHSITTVMLKFLFTRIEWSVNVDKIWGITSPTTIMYETPTPKHLMAIAKSKMTLSFGFVTCVNAKNDAFLSGTYFVTFD